MKKLFLLAFILNLFFVFNSTMNSSDNCDLYVNIYNFSSASGNVRVHLYDLSRKNNFPNNSENIYKLVIGKIKSGKSQVKFANIPRGYYAISIHHDANLNIKMDKTFLGLPDEGWGVSNNIKPVMRVPNFDECKFYVKSNPTSITIRINN